MKNYTIEVTSKTGLYDYEVLFRYKTRLETDRVISIGADINSKDINVSATGTFTADDDVLMEGFLKAIKLARDLAIGNVQLID